MKVLFLHPDDRPESRPWAAQKWDHVYDLGQAGAIAYERWGTRFGCPVTAVQALRDGFREVRRVHEILAQGTGLLRDREGLDWWELTAIFFHHLLEDIVVLRKLASRFTAADEVWLSRPCQQGDVLSATLNRPIPSFQVGRQSKGLGHYGRTLARLRFQQAVEIFWDKYDGGYGIRRLFARRRAASRVPVVLVPSAYGNVSRTGVAYSRITPDLNFLIVATRRSGWLKELPANVSAASLAAYGGAPASAEQELAGLLNRWVKVRMELENTAEIGVLAKLGMLDRFPGYFRTGLAVRDAWRRVLEQESVQAVLCADDSNPYTHIPLLLAKARGLPTVSCHHGALDGRHLVKLNHADTVLAKGEMERDYVTRTCGLQEADVEIGAPGEPANLHSSRRDDPIAIVFFSEAYEILGGRTEEFYRDVLPPLADMALHAGKRLVVKLHPVESHRERGRLVGRLLTVEQRRITELVSGPLGAELLDQTWAGVTILSTVATECVRRRIPCFLCEWLDYGSYGYVEQFIRFGVGYGLKSAADLRRIPEIMKVWRPSDEVIRRTWTPIRGERLRELLSPKGEHGETVMGRCKPDNRGRAQQLMGKTLLVRADASVATGTGHVMRCLALAQAWQDAGGSAMFALAEATPSIAERLRRENFEIAHLSVTPGSGDDAVQTSALARQKEATWVATDGYLFDGRYQEELKSNGLRVLFIDDNGHAQNYTADLVLNQNAHAAACLHEKRAPYTRLLLGPTYAMLRREFASWRDWQRDTPAVARRILVTMGGSDPDNFTLRVLESLEQIRAESLEVVVVVGGSNPHRSELEAATKRSRQVVRLMSNVESMAELMAWADVAVSGAGTTSWEMCCLGLPTLLADLASNQVPVAQRLHELGVVRHIGSSRDCSAATIADELARLLDARDMRSQMSRRGRELVDGRGAFRVVAAMMDKAIQLRPARESDCRLLWEWANEPGVRASSFSQQPIAWDEHTAWFHEKLADADCTIFIGEDEGGRPLGQVRIERRADGEGEIDVSVAREFRGSGYGSLLIDAALRETFECTGTTKIHAFIRPENVASAQAFEKAGFQRMGETQVKGHTALHYVREREC